MRQGKTDILSRRLTDNGCECGGISDGYYQKIKSTALYDKRIIVPEY